MYVPGVTVVSADFDGVAVATCLTFLTDAAFANPCRAVLCGGTRLHFHVTGTCGVAGFHLVAVASLGSRYTRTNGALALVAVGTSRTFFLNAPACAGAVAHFHFVAVATGGSGGTGASFTEATVTVFAVFASHIVLPTVASGLTDLNSLAVTALGACGTGAQTTGCAAGIAVLGERARLLDRPGLATGVTDHEVATIACTGSWGADTRLTDTSRAELVAATGRGDRVATTVRTTGLNAVAVATLGSRSTFTRLTRAGACFAVGVGRTRGRDPSVTG